MNQKGAIIFKKFFSTVLPVNSNLHQSAVQHTENFQVEILSLKDFRIYYSEYLNGKDLYKDYKANT